jgi:hypothetical protein
MIYDNPDLYGLFLSRCGQFADKEIDRFNVIHYQIVPNKNSQKLVLCCDNVDQKSIDEIDAQIKECFKVECRWVRNEKWNAHQVTIDLVMDSFSENVTYRKKLHDQMKNNNIGSRANIKEPPVVKDLDIDLDYTFFQMIQNRFSVESFTESFIYAPVINITINNITNNITNNYGNKLDSTSIWIKKNPPYDRQNTTEYFNTYHADAVKQVRIQEFSTLVKAAGYRQMRIKNSYSWVVR